MIGYHKEREALKIENQMEHFSKRSMQEQCEERAKSAAQKINLSQEQIEVLKQKVIALNKKYAKLQEMSVWAPFVTGVAGVVSLTALPTLVAFLGCPQEVVTLVQIGTLSGTIANFPCLATRPISKLVVKARIKLLQAKLKDLNTAIDIEQNYLNKCEEFKNSTPDCSIRF